ncbi:MAG: cysteine synthase A [Myxococcales bacterium]|nr:cysteine synthase A [Myxococcales bacterium]
MGHISPSVFDCVGATPLVRLSRVGTESPRAEVCMKLEMKNPGGSIKDRPARAMILGAEARGELVPGSVIIEATSGNTGVSLAMLAAVRGYRCIVVMPEDMSLERRYLLRAYGAEVELTPKSRGMRGAVERAQQLHAALPKAMLVRQFENPDNLDAHATTTADELWEQTDGRIDVLVAGVGTGGTITGTARALRKRLPTLRVVAVEPAKAAALAGRPFAPHAIQGIGAGFVSSLVDLTLIDEAVTVEDDDALEHAALLARTEGILGGPSSGANLYVALAEARRLGPDARVVTFACDTGERYLL